MTSGSRPAAEAPGRTRLDDLAIQTIRFLAVDAVERAHSGHPGAPMGLADLAYVLWTRYLRYRPDDPAWPDRDRFVLSAGHASMLLYAMLHLSGYDLPLEELQRFRQLGSRTPGHPENTLTPGVETTTGPLGQGFGNGVGMALAGRILAARFNHAEFSPTTFRVFGIVSDGDIMEGVASEAASLAGHWGLGNLIYFYDDNDVTIDGKASLSLSEDVGRRFEAYGWHVQRADPYDLEALSRAVDRALAEGERPSLIAVRSHIGYGAPHKQDTSKAHGEPLGPEELAGAKRRFGWPEEPTFRVPDEVRARFRDRARELEPEVDRWREALAAWRRRDPRRAAEWDALLERRIPSDVLERLLAQAPTGAGATRVHGGRVVQQAAALVPSLLGGAADLDSSTRTSIQDSPSILRGQYAGRNLHFGIREHAMGAILNGLSLSGAFVPYGSSFLIFTDYARPAIRLSALMRRQVVWVFTHDSVFLGEDGPTHQPIEQLAALRAIPNLLVVRPADGAETAGAWGLALERRDGPTLIALTRQKLPELERDRPLSADDVRRGAYVLEEAESADAVTIVASGSEVWLAQAAARRLAAAGTPARVVSMPAPTRFLEQDARWRASVLPPGGRRVSLEAGATFGWAAVVGERGLSIGLDRFGESAPYEALQRHLGFTPEQVAERVRAWLAG